MADDAVVAALDKAVTRAARWEMIARRLTEIVPRDYVGEAENDPEAVAVGRVLAEFRRMEAGIVD